MASFEVSPQGKARTFSSPAITDPAALVFGRAPRPVRCGLGLQLGAGQVFPEINFTLPPMVIDQRSWRQVCEIYDSLMVDLLMRTRDLHVPGLVVEFEQLPPMTAEPAWGAELTRCIKGHLRRAHEEWGLAAALRVTIVDLRDDARPPQRRRGTAWNKMLAALEQSAGAGADILSIESTGGKEVHDAALTRADLPGIVFALGVLAPRDMRWLWDAFVQVAGKHGVLAGGDSACGFANTAMQLAGRKMLPEVLAALVRALTAVRSLVAYERGALGPSKDCAYEGPVMKAIAGVPISMEGRSATCAHLSPIGNIAAAAADLWSNESVQDTPLLSGRAPVASLESLVYDCRLMNAALERGSELELRDLHVVSDAGLSPQAAVLTPEVTVALAQAITAERDPYRRVLAAGRTAFAALDKGVAGGSLALDVRERRWLDKLRRAFEALPDTAERLLGVVLERYRGMFDPAAYGLDI
jgi:methanol--5-hydroxybenzimidazolylcobamide Co-methyltransferase